MPPASPKRWRSSHAWDDVILSSLRDSWAHKLGTRKLKVTTTPLPAGQVRHQLHGLWDVIAYVDRPAGERLPANRHLKALVEAPHWVDRLSEACLALSNPPGAQAGTSLPVAALATRYQQLHAIASQALVRSVWNFAGHDGDARVLCPDTEEVLWCYALPNPQWYTLWQCSGTIAALLKARQVRQEECFQELLGA